MLGHQGVDRRNARDVDDGDAGAGVDDPLEEILHDHLGAGAVERTDQRQGQDAVPQLHDRRGQLEHLLLLTVDELLAPFLIDLDSEQRETI